MGLSPKSLWAAQVPGAVEPVTKHRENVPPALSALVMRCLAKRPADRWQSATEILDQLEQLATPTASMPYDPIAAATRGHPVRVAGLFALGSLVLLGVVYFLMTQLGLPGWVMGAAIALLAVGLPLMVTTGLLERRRALAGGLAPVGGNHWLTWRRAFLSGAAGFGLLGLGTAVYMAMRLLGIGPVGTLVASGVLAQRDRLVLADFENRTADSTLGPSLTEALRVDLAQSGVIRLLDAAAVGQALGRMGRAPGASLDLALARELAQREGAKAVVHGQVDPLGRGYVVSAELVSAADGAALVSVRETAQDDGAIIAAVDRLSGRLRERIGESLKTIRARDLAEAYYYTRVEYDPTKVEVAYRAALEQDPENGVALNNLALHFNELRRFAEAESLTTRGIAVAPTQWALYLNGMQAQIGQGKFADAARTAGLFARRAPGNPMTQFVRCFLAAARRDYDSAEVETQALAQSTRDPTWQAGAASALGALGLVRGKLTVAVAQFRREMALNEQRGVPGKYLEDAIGLAVIDVHYRNAPAAAQGEVETALRRHPLASIPAADRPYVGLAWLYAHIGRPDRARQLLAEFEAAIPEAERRSQPFRHGAAAEIAFAEGRVQDAIKGYRAWYDEGSCAVCGLYLLARAYERAGQRDSAIAVYERAVTTPGYTRALEESATLGPTYRRLGELYQERGDTTRARDYYTRFVSRPR